MVTTLTVLIQGNRDTMNFSVIYRRDIFFRLSVCFPVHQIPVSERRELAPKRLAIESIPFLTREAKHF